MYKPLCLEDKADLILPNVCGEICSYCLSSEGVATHSISSLATSLRKLNNLHILLVHTFEIDFHLKR